MTTTRLPKTITAGALLATPIPPVKWIIPGLLPAGLAIFAGPSKAGKSWLTLWLCLQISQGKSVWGRETEPRTVLYFSLEDTLGRLQERLYQLVMQKKTRNGSFCRRKVTELGRDWRNKSSVSSILTPILASSSSIPCKRCEKPSEMVVCMPMIIRTLVH